MGSKPGPKEFHKDYADAWVLSRIHRVYTDPPDSNWRGLNFRLFDVGERGCEYGGQFILQ